MIRIGLTLLSISAVSLVAFQGADQHLPPRPPGFPLSDRARQPNVPLLQPEPTDSEQKAIRNARSSIFKSGGNPLPLDTTANFHFLLVADMRSMPELPITEENTDVVLYGQVTRSQVFVNGRRIGLYTDYTVKVGRTLRPIDQHAEGTDVSVLRVGGLAKYPSGGVVEHEVRGYGPEPAVGSQYLFFLKRLPEPANAYTFLKFWNVVPGYDGAILVVKAAFDQDIFHARNQKSSVDGKSLAEISAMIQAAR